MIKGNRAHMKVPKCRRGHAEFFDPADPGERLERDGKLERIHLPDERVLEPGPGSGRTQDPDSIGRQVGRAKKRQAWMWSQWVCEMRR